MANEELNAKILASPPGGALRWMAAADGWPLRYGIWRPSGEARGTVLLLEGRTEFIEKYHETIGDLLSRGFAVLIFDWRGQGASRPHDLPGDKDDLEDFSSRLSDLRQIMEGSLRALPKPHFALAHSMGAHLLLRHLLDHKTGLAAAILAAPMLTIGFHGFAPLVRGLALAARLLGRSGDFVLGQAPYGRWNSSERRCNLMTSDRARFRAEHELVRRNPVLGLGGVSWRWLEAVWNSARILTAAGNPERIALPLLITLHGRDRVVGRRAIARYARRLPNAVLRVFPEARHEILIERDEIRNAFWQAFDDFIEPFYGGGKLP